MRRTTSVLAAAAVLLAPMAVGLTRSADARVTLVRDPDRESTALTTWRPQTHLDFAVPASEVVDQHEAGWRTVDVEVASVDPLTFDAVYVRNAGTYARTASFSPALTAFGVSQLQSSGKRLLDVERYVLPGGDVRFAVSSIANTGAAQKTSTWRSDATQDQVNALRGNGYRITDLERRLTLDGVRYTVVAVKRTGVDDVASWVYTGRTTQQVKDLLAANRARLVDIERVGNGWDVVMNRAGSGSWWWFTGLSAERVRTLAEQLGARVVRLEPYTDGDVTRYAAIMLNNLDPESTRIRNLVSDRMRGSWGFSVRRVGEGMSQAALGQDIRFEPASMIKIVHALAAFREIQADGIDYLDKVTWYAHPSYPARNPGDTNYQDNKNRCAYTDEGAKLTTRSYADDFGPNVVRYTMTQSDNRRTDALYDRYGVAGLNALMDTAGMTSSELYHRIGCPWKAMPVELRKDNVLTLTDSGRLYERIVDNTLIDTSNEALLFANMLGGAIDPDGRLGRKLYKDAVAAGLTSTQAASFVRNVVTRSKGGSYGRCPTTGDCAQTTLQHRTVGGVIWLPFKVDGSIQRRPFVYGRFFNAAFPCSFEEVRDKECTSFQTQTAGMDTIALEMFDRPVRQALATW